jgi:hypothetical protein
MLAKQLSFRLRMGASLDSDRDRDRDRDPDPDPDLDLDLDLDLDPDQDRLPRLTIHRIRDSGDARGDWQRIHSKIKRQEAARLLRRVTVLGNRSAFPRLSTGEGAVFFIIRFSSRLRGSREDCEQVAQRLPSAYVVAREGARRSRILGF